MHSFLYNNNKRLLLRTATTLMTLLYVEAANGNRTHDLVLTKDVLYLLSYRSAPARRKGTIWSTGELSSVVHLKRWRGNESVPAGSLRCRWEDAS